MATIRSVFLGWLLSVVLLAASMAACGSTSDGADAGTLDALQDPGPDMPEATDPGGDAPDDPGPADPGATDPGGSDPAPIDAGDEAPWQFDRDAYAPIRGWILLDGDPEKVMAALDEAPAYGINHVQLSHDLVMNFEDLLGDDAATTTRVQVLNDAIAAAHDRGIKAFIWVHEFGGNDLVVCYGPDGDIWTQRAAAWNAALDRNPDVDGVVLMFGSAPMSPWFTACDCAWCVEEWGDEGPFETPPNDERIRLITEALGQVLAVRGKEMVARVFVHEPQELAWHADGFAATGGLDFVGMHKSDVGDWQPYNPHDPTVGNVGPHPSVLEVDVGGEYYGASRLPFCSPGYFRYRMQHAWENRGIGFVARIERGSNRALGTPNEINLRMLTAFVEDPETPLAAVWEDFLLERYGVAPGKSALLLRGWLENTFPIRLKSHYALGIWALDKGTDIPAQAEFGELFNRGNMPKWDPAWQGVFDRVKSPDRSTVLDLWQEGSEAVELSAQDLAEFEGWAAVSPDALRPEDRDDLAFRFRHQAFAARAWRAVDLFLWAQRARALAGAEPDPDFVRWAAWARDELASVRQEMIDAGLGAATPAGPARIQSFLDATATAIPEETTPEVPPPALIGLVSTLLMPDGRVQVRFTIRKDASAVSLTWGKSLPVLDRVRELGPAVTGQEFTVYVGAEAASLEQHADQAALDPSSRYVLRVVATAETVDGGVRPWLGGDWWVFTPPPCECGEDGECVEGMCVAVDRECCCGACGGQDFCAPAPAGDVDCCWQDGFRLVSIPAHCQLVARCPDTSSAAWCTDTVEP